MSEYKEIHGQSIQAVSSNPTNQFSGQIWYNKTTGKINMLGFSSTGTWATGANMGNGRYTGATAGTQTAAIAFGGGISVNTESYDGSTWTNLPSSHNNPAMIQTDGTGTETSALLVAGGGYPEGYSDVLEYNGSSWTSGGNLGLAGYGVGALGTQTAALAMGGKNWFFDQYRRVRTEHYDGTSWTQGGDMSTARLKMGTAGTETAGLIFAGGDTNYPYTKTNVTEEYNGTSWTSGGTYGTPAMGMASFGTQTAAIGAGGGTYPASGGTSNSYSYDGSSWTAGGSLSSSREGNSGDGSTSAGFSIGGNPATGDSLRTEEWNGAGPVVLSLDAS